MSTLNRYHIDYFSLDVEGVDMFMDRLTIDVFTIETNVIRDTIMTCITTHGYKWITKVAEDDVFMKE